MLFIAWVICIFLIVRIATDTMEKQENKPEQLDE